MITTKIDNYPITPFLEEICKNLKSSDSRFLILTAETAAGKSTILPLSLLENFNGKIIMTEPRRLAALSVANRVSDLLEDEVGNTVGYKVHLENKISRETRLEVVTEAILVRQLQNNPELDGINVVVLDEFHERSINTDLCLAFLKEAMMLREDLYVIVMSATIDTDGLKEYLGENTRVMKIPGRQYPVDFIYKDKTTVESAIIEELNNSGKDILVFLPGISDIKKVEQNLVEAGVEQKADICVLHSSIGLAAQKKIITENQSEKRRVILSSAIAETSLTVPGITCVIDSGLSKISRINLATGMESLGTETESEFSASQRAGRAGRVQAGKCIRLWSQANPRIKNIPAEILRADITNLVLECADRGISNVNQIDWFEQPGDSAWETSKNLLVQLGMIDTFSKITEKGKAALTLGMHPRLANIVLETGNVNLVIEYLSYNQSSNEMKAKFKEIILSRLQKLEYFNKNNSKNNKQGLDLLFGFPDRLAKRISEKGKTPVEYQFPTGRKAFLYENFQKAEEWIVAPEVMLTNNTGAIHKFEALESNLVNDWLPEKIQKKIDCFFKDGKIEKYENACYGEIVLSSKKLAASGEDVCAAWCTQVIHEGIKCLPIDQKTENFLVRAAFYKHISQAQLESELVQKVNDWLPPFITSDTKLNEEAVYNALFCILDGAAVDKEVPTLVRLPNGNKCKVKYEMLSSPEDKNVLIIRPVIEIIIQRIFGCFETPEVCGVKVLLRLLSPANRPLQVTDDLEHFWTGAWVEICKEMKGRYPKHNWDYKITQEDK